MTTIIIPALSSPPQDRIYCFAMTQTALEAYSSDYDPSILYADGYSTGADLVVLFMTLWDLYVAAALLLPFIKTLETGNEKIFSYPFEPVCLIALCVISVAVSITANPGHSGSSVYPKCAHKHRSL